MSIIIKQMKAVEHIFFLIVNQLSSLIIETESFYFYSCCITLN